MYSLLNWNLLFLACALFSIGFGFGIRPTPEPGVSIRKQGEMPQISKEEAIQRTKAELEATREREKLLDQRMRELDAVAKQQQS